MTNDQATPIPGAGHDYFKMFSETVNPANGSLSVRISVPVPPGRRIALPFSFAYDSNGVLHPGSAGHGVLSWFTNAGYLSQGGWSYSVPQLSEQWRTLSAGGYTCNYYVDYVFSDPNGGRHALGLSNWDPASISQCKNTPGAPDPSLKGGDDQFQGITPDPTKYTGGSPMPVLVSSADGTVYSFPGNGGLHSPYIAIPSSIEDRNGNIIKITDSGGGAFTVNDTLDRPAISSSGFGASTDQVTVSGMDDSYKIAWDYTTYNPSYGVGSQKQGSDPNCPASIPNEGNIPIPVIKSITLPGGQGSYSFTYDQTYGLLKQIVYPSGAWVKYTWSMIPQYEYGAFQDSAGTPEACQYIYGVPAVTDRQVGFGSLSSNPILDQTFSYKTPLTWTSGTWNTKTTTVYTTDELRLQGQWPRSTTIYTYSSVSIATPPNEVSHVAAQVPVEQSISYSDWGGAPLETVTKAWQDQFLMTQERTTPAGGGTAEKDYTYKAFCGAVCETWLLIDEKDYDYASSPPGTLLKETALPSPYYYWTPATSPIFGFGPSITQAPVFYPNVLDRPLAVITCNATPCSSSQNRVAETDYTYDGSNPTSASGFWNHDDPNYGTTNGQNRGNATTKKEWVSTTGSSLSWNYSYDQTGQVGYMCDNQGCPAGQTTYSYSNQNGYLASVLAGGLTWTYGYDAPTGELTQSADPNTSTNPTLYKYEAADLKRLKEIDYPDGGVTTYTYLTTCGSPSTMWMAPAYTETYTLDDFCRVTRKDVTDSPEDEYTDTSYDGIGRVWTVSNPYFENSSPAYTTTTYDALGRVSDEGATPSILYPDQNSTSTTYSYSSNYSSFATTVDDPLGTTRKTYTDGLGRLKRVQEDPLHAGYITTYTHDALGDLTGVAQGSQQTRTFAYDSLSRLTSATNPESGTTGYGYTNGSSLCSGDPSNVCTRTDARGIVTTYSYSADALNRLIGKSYSDGTPPVTMSYDQSSVTIGSWSSGTLTNPKGRLTEAITGPIGSPQTAVVYSYDPMGRTAAYWQCTPVFCANSNPLEASYTYDPAGDLQSWVHPAHSLTFTNTISPARRITAIAAAANVLDMPTSLVPNISYTPWGAIASITDGCTGSSCTPIQETYTYNNRMQPVTIQVGTVANPSANYCLVYNYYTGVSNPTTCTAPSAGIGNNGTVIGMVYLDNGATTSSYSYSAKYTYDGVNRLTSAVANTVASGNSTYNLAYSYTGDGSTGQFGNMSCTSSGYPFAVCPNYTYNAATNRFTNTGYTYDLAGNTTSDTTFQYQWDAEGRMSKSLQSSTVEHAYTYNALGQRVEDIPNGQTTQELFYDPAGQFLGSYFDFSPQPGWWYVAVPSLGRTLIQTEDWYIGQAWYLHYNALGSLVQYTTQTGLVTEGDIQTYPWGQTWQYTGPMWPGIYAGLMSYLCQVQPCPDQSETRDYPSNFQRWMTPDPGNAGAEPSDPQTWNMYAYAGNNPTTNVDPNGEDCISTSNQTTASVTVSVTAGQTCSEGQTYVAGTVDTSSFTYNGTSLGYSFTPYANATGLTYGLGSLPLGQPDQALSPFAQGVLGSVYQQSAGPVNFFAGATFLPLSFYGPGTLADSLSLPMNLSDGEPPEINWGKQEKHFEGANNYQPGRSTLTANPEKLAQQAGTGTPMNNISRGMPGFKERVDFGEVIGMYKDPVTGFSAPTTKGMIIYAGDGSIHIVPVRP